MARLVPFGLLLLPAAALAQGSASRPGDRYYVDPDTIYSLAVDPMQHLGEDYVLLLDDGIVALQQNGRSRRTYHQIIQILTQDGAELWGEHEYSWTEGRQRFTLDWVHVVGADGGLISDGPRHQQESAAPVSQAIPVYTDTRVFRFSVGGLAAGTLLDFAYTQETLEPYLPGDFNSSWYITTDVPVLRSRLVVELPASVQPHIQEVGLAFQRSEYEYDGRRAYVWSASDVPVSQSEPYSSWPDDGTSKVYVSGALDWEEIGRWYSQLSRDRYQLTPALESTLAGLVAGATTRADSVRAVHGWVTHDFRYVSLSLGIGGYQPRMPADVFETRAGDCKDMATLFVAALRSLEIQAYPVLLNSAGLADSLVPSLAEFDHVIAAVAQPDGYVYTDLTTELLPYGMIPYDLQGGFALVVRPDGESERVIIPVEPAESNRLEMTISGQLSEDGEFRGRFSETGSGIHQVVLSSAIQDIAKLNAQEKDQMLSALAGGLFRGARGDSLEITVDFGTPDYQPLLALNLYAPDALSRAGRSYVLELPYENPVDPSVVAELESAPRRNPIDVEQVVGRQMLSWRLELTLPDGWQVELPESIEAESPFGRYTSSYSQGGNTFRLERSLSGRDGVQPANAVSDLIDWFTAVLSDDSRYVAIIPAGGS